MSYVRIRIVRIAWLTEELIIAAPTQGKRPLRLGPGVESYTRKHGSERGLEHISVSLGGVLKEVVRRDEPRQRLEAERGPISDDEFLEMVERSGGVEL